MSLLLTWVTWHGGQVSTVFALDDFDYGDGSTNDGVPDTITIAAPNIPSDANGRAPYDEANFGYRVALCPPLFAPYREPKKNT